MTTNVSYTLNRILSVRKAAKIAYELSSAEIKAVLMAAEQNLSEHHLTETIPQELHELRTALGFVENLEKHQGGGRVR